MVTILRVAICFQTIVMGAAQSAAAGHTFTAQQDSPRLHAAAWANKLSPTMSVFMASASQMVGSVTIFGHGSVPVRSLNPFISVFQKRIDDYRAFLLRMPYHPRDVLLIMDAFDTMLVKPGGEILEHYLALERRSQKELFLSTEPHCAHRACVALERVPVPDKLLPGNVSKQWPYRWTNPGLIIGRVSAFKALAEKMALAGNILNCTDCHGDMAWFAEYFAANTQTVGLDYRCELFQTAYGIEGLLTGPWAQTAGQPEGALKLSYSALGIPVVVNALTQTTPAALHFAGLGHWSRKAPCRRDPSRICETSLMVEAFGALLPELDKATDLRDMKELSDSLDLPWFLRTVRPYHFESMLKLLRVIKERDLELTLTRNGLGIVSAIALLLVLVVGLRLPSSESSKTCCPVSTHVAPKDHEV